MNYKAEAIFSLTWKGWLRAVFTGKVVLSRDFLLAAVIKADRAIHNLQCDCDE